jgi:hypothetical protein
LPSWQVSLHGGRSKYILMQYMKLLAFILNLPWTSIGLLASIISIPKKITFSKNPFAIIISVKSFWWYSWLPGKKGVRAMVNGSVVQMGPTADEKDLEHELIHVRQYEQAPFIHPFLYTYQSWRYGYRLNKYEQEAYDKSGSRDFSL